MKIVDERTDAEKNRLTVAVVGRDKFLSGWGEAIGGYSRAAWACTPEDVQKVERWVRARGDMSYVRVVAINRYRPSKGTVHLQIYAVRPGHPALG